MKNVTNLDFLRSVAVLLVVHSHYIVYTGRLGQDGWSGITGVCMFFVHTSLVLMWSLERDPEVSHFYVRRIFRIYPLWIAVLSLVLLLHLPQSPSFSFHFPRPVNLIANYLLLCNLWGSPDLVGASWTLPLEVQMYLFLPFLFFFIRSTRSLWPLLLVDAFIIMFDLRMYPPTVSYLPMCVPYFLPGIMAYVLSKRKDVQRIPSWLFPLFLAVIIYVDRWHGTFRHSWVFCLSLGLAVPFFRDMHWKPIQIASHYVAKYSYGIYLTHISAIVVSVYMLRGYSLFARIATFTVMFLVLPFLLYHLLEEPMIRLGARLAKKIGGGKVPKINEAALELEPAP